MDGIRAFDEQKKEKCVSIVRFVKASYVRANKKTHTQKWKDELKAYARRARGKFKKRKTQQQKLAYDLSCSFVG